MMEYLSKIMSYRASLFVLMLWLVLAIASSQAIPIDGASNHKEVHQIKVSPIETTVAPQIATQRIESESTKKIEGIHKSHTSTLHPSVNLESVKVSTGNHHETISNHRPLVTETPNSMKSSQDDGPDPLHRLCDYLKPICTNSTDKIAPKQLFKIQGQFKRIVQVSAGKLGFCFLEHYGFDPNLNPITKDNLVTICSSKDMSPKLKGSYKSFEACALQNWDASVDNELDKILAARENCTKNHDHPGKIDSSETSLTHEDDEDEFSLISDVVNKVFEDNKGQFANSSDVKFIDVSTGFPTTPKPVSFIHLSSIKPSKGSPKEASMTEINKIVAALDSKTTSAPSTGANNKTILHHQVDQIVSKSPLLTTSSSTLKSVPAIKGEHNKTNDVSLTSQNENHQEKSTFLADGKHSSESNSTETEVKMLSTSNGTPPGSVSLKSTTLKPDAIASIKESDSPSTKLEDILRDSKTTVAPKTIAASSTTTTSPPITTLKPILETLEEVLKRQEKEKKELDDRLRLERERVIKQLQKKQDEIDARNAIKALQIQRDASNNQNSDARLHLLEHDRQMSIDPIGHTIKHQQYEMIKQQKMMNGKK